MKAAIISYSLTGNNFDLAKGLANILNAEHVCIQESKKRTTGTILFDVIFNRTPQINYEIDKIEEYELVIFVGPIWMGQIATPFRSFFKNIGGRINKYAFVSISGGADGPNPKIADELQTRLSKNPVSVIDLHIADILTLGRKPTRKDTSTYKLNEGDIRNLTTKIAATLNQEYKPSLI